MRYMLDTNMVSYAIKGKPSEVRQRIKSLLRDVLVISAVTQAELLYGVKRAGSPEALSRLVREFLMRIEVLPWDAHVATVYADLRATCTAAGITLDALDLMIAAHAVAEKAILVTYDKAFSLIPNGLLTIEDWCVNEHKKT
jgi:tRNA(fMet)-specific endonuclease VapC